MGRRRKKSFEGQAIFIGGVIFLVAVGSALIAFIDWWGTIPTTSKILMFLSIIFVVLALITYKRHKQKIRRQLAEERRKENIIKVRNLSAMKNMSPRNFEFFVSDLFEEMGYSSEVTKATGDGGKDIILYKDGLKYIVECKRYANQKITVNLIRQFHSVIIDTGAVKGFFVTTSDFTKDARHYAADKQIDLINGDKLLDVINQIKGSSINYEISSETKNNQYI